MQNDEQYLNLGKILVKNDFILSLYSFRVTSFCWFISCTMSAGNQWGMGKEFCSINKTARIRAKP